MKRTKLDRIIASLIAAVMVIGLLAGTGVFAGGEAEPVYASSVEDTAEGESVVDAATTDGVATLVGTEENGTNTAAADNTTVTNLFAEDANSLDAEDDLAGSAGNPDSGMVGVFVVTENSEFSKPYLYAWGGATNGDSAPVEMTNVTSNFSYGNPSTSSIFYREIPSDRTGCIVCTGSTTNSMGTKANNGDITISPESSRTANVAYSSTLNAYIIGINKDNIQLYEVNASYLTANTSVSVSSSNVSLNVNGTQTLTATSSGFSGTVTYNWTSDNTSIATVAADSDDSSKATITAAGMGSTNITVTATDSSNNSATATVNVTVTGYVRIYYAYAADVTSTNGGGSTAAWNSIKNTNTIYVVYNNTAAQMTASDYNTDAGYTVYYYDLPIDSTTKTIFFSCANTASRQNVTTGTNDVVLTITNGQLASYKTKSLSSGNEETIAISDPEHTFFTVTNQYSGNGSTDYNYTVSSGTFVTEGISLTASPTELNVGGTSTLTVKATNFMPVSYSWSISSGTDYVEWSTTPETTSTSATIKGKAAGTATIKCEARDANNVTKEATATVTVDNYTTVYFAIKAEQWGATADNYTNLSDYLFVKAWNSAAPNESQENYNLTYQKDLKINNDDSYAVYSVTFKTGEKNRFFIGKRDNKDSYDAYHQYNGNDTLYYQTFNLDIESNVIKQGYWVYKSASNDTIDSEKDLNINVNIPSGTYVVALGNGRYVNKSDRKRGESGADNFYEIRLKTLALPATDVSVSLSPSTIATNGTTTATAVLEPDGATYSSISWTVYNASGENVSSNTDSTKNIFTVTPSTDGKTATITLTSDAQAAASYNNTKYTVVATVTNSDNTAVTSVKTPGESTTNLEISNANLSSASISPDTVSVNAGSTASLTLTVSPENVCVTGITWSSEDSGIATVTASSPAAGEIPYTATVTGVAEGTTSAVATITYTYNGVSQTKKVYASITVTPQANDGKVYFNATLSKFWYKDSGDHGIPRNGTTNVYFFAAKDTSGTDAVKGTASPNQEAMTVNGRTYPANTIYTADLHAAIKTSNSNASDTAWQDYKYICFADYSMANYTAFPSDSYVGDTGRLTIDWDITNPCFYAGTSDKQIYEGGYRVGYWDALGEIYDPKKVTNTDVVYVAKETYVKPTVDTHKNGTDYKNTDSSGNAKITYLPSTLYDYYTDYELNGRERSTYTKNINGASYRNWNTFREFDQALSDYYYSKNTTAYGKSGIIPIYTGHFQPDYSNWGTRFTEIWDAYGLFGYNNNENRLNGETVNNSTMSTDGTGAHYPDAAQGLVSSKLDGGLKTNDRSAILPQFNTSFLLGENSKNAILGAVYDDVQFPFVQKKDSVYTDTYYYTFDSAQTTLMYRTDANDTSYLEDVGNWENSKNVNSSSQTSDVSTAYGYFPFNEDSSTTDANTYDYGFGTKLEFTFTLESDGNVSGTTTGADDTASGKKAPTVFKFSGDDDVWVFIDDVLVLDLGGSHGQVQGAINFSTTQSATAKFDSVKKELSVNQASVAISSAKANPSGVKYTSKTIEEMFTDALGDNGKAKYNALYSGSHKLTLYYMERGMWESNMMVAFNFSPKKNINIKKLWRNASDRELDTSKWSNTVYYAVFYKDGDGNLTPYAINNAASADIDKYTVSLSYSDTDTDGNHWAKTLEVDDAENRVYYVYEAKLDSDGKPQWSDETNHVVAHYENGEKFSYNGDDYEVSGSGAVNGSAANIKNTRQNGTSVTITKDWSGVTNEDAILPNTVYVKLMRYVSGYQSATEEQVPKSELGAYFSYLTDTSDTTDTGTNSAHYVIGLTKTMNWTLTLSGLPSRYDGSTTSYTDMYYVYYFKEVNADGTDVTDNRITLTSGSVSNKSYTYTITGGTVASGKATITNALVVPKVSLTINKVWKNTEGNRITTSEDTDSTYPTVSVYLKRTCTYTSTGGTETTVTQYYTSGGNFTENRDSASAIRIMRSASPEWSATLSNLDVYYDYANGYKWTYSIYGESSATTSESDGKIIIGENAYEVKYGSTANGTFSENTGFTPAGTESESGNLTVTNTQQATASVTVKKVWQDVSGNDAPGSHSENIYVYLKRYTKNSSTQAEENVKYLSSTNVNSGNASTIIGLDGYAGVSWVGNTTPSTSELEASDSKRGNYATPIELNSGSGYTVNVSGLPKQDASGNTYYYQIVGELYGVNAGSKPSENGYTYVYTYANGTKVYKISEPETKNSKTQITITNTADSTGNVYDVSYGTEVNGSASGTKNLTVTNKLYKEYELPALGSGSGWNIWLYLIAGIAFLITILLQRKHAGQSGGRFFD